MADTTEGLRELQDWMLGALMDPLRVTPKELLARVMPGARMGAADCLAIYQRSYIWRLRHCLRSQFPALRHALGDALFDDFADDYLKDCPSRSHTLFDLGQRLSGWLEETRPDRLQPEDQRESWIDFLIDLADYEHALFRLFDAPGQEESPWPDTGCDDADLVLQPCLVLRTYRFPVARYYHEVRARATPVPPSPAQSHLVLLRKDHRPITCPVTPWQFAFLQTLSRTEDVAAALVSVALRTGRSVDAAQRSWREDVREGWIGTGFFVRRSERAVPPLAFMGAGKSGSQ